MDTKRCTFRSSPKNTPLMMASRLEFFIDFSCPKMIRIFRNLVNLQKELFITQNHDKCNQIRAVCTEVELRGPLTTSHLSVPESHGISAWPRGTRTCLTWPPCKSFHQGDILMFVSTNMFGDGPRT